MPLPMIAQLSYCGTELKIPDFETLGIKYGFLGVKNESEATDFARPTQKHGVEVIQATKTARGKLETEADGIYTTVKDLPVAVATADCLPILLVDKTKRMGMALHAGWRGLSAGIVECGIKKFATHAIRAKDLYVATGPCISQAKYEVGQDVIEAFRVGDINLTTEQHAAVFSQGCDDRMHLDLALAAVYTLTNLGVPANQISVVRRCTHAEADEWYSYRRTKQYQGNNISFVRLPVG
jgi:YfiH family protein